MSALAYLVDTDVLSETAKPTPNPGVLAWLAERDRVAVSAVTVFELSRGIDAVTSVKRRTFLEEWLASVLDGPIEVLSFDTRAARAAAQLDADSRRRGRPIETRDLFILATAHAAGLHIATHNVRHFAGRGVLVVDPFAEPSK